MPPGDLYAALGLDKHATEAEIKRAYRTLAMTCHPDKNLDDPTAKEKFHSISEAYSTLSDSEKRARYDGEPQHSDAVDDIMRVRLPQTQLRTVHMRLMLLPLPYFACQAMFGGLFQMGGFGYCSHSHTLLPLCHMHLQSGL
jgi:DnaJ-class molecular chaperone